MEALNFYTNKAKGLMQPGKGYGIGLIAILILAFLIFARRIK